MRTALAALLFIALTTAAASQPLQTVASRLIVHRNPDYGPLTPQDLEATQRCKDDFIAEASRLSEPYNNRRMRRAINLNAPTLEAAIVVAAAISTCIAARGLEGLHVTPVNVPVRPLLR